MAGVIELEIHDIATLVQSIYQAHGRLRASLLWYRGQGEAGLDLQPSVYRKHSREQEKGMVSEFRRRAYSRHDRCPDDSDLGSWLCLMQHHGVPTRMLDWTASPLTALVFALLYAPSMGPAALWALAPTKLNDRLEIDGIAYFNHSAVYPIARCAAVDGECRGVVAVLPPESNLRLTLQQGSFTIHADRTPLNQDPDAAQWLVKMVIPADAKYMLSAQLEMLGVKSSLLFPDLDHLAREVGGGEKWRESYLAERRASLNRPVQAGTVAPPSTIAVPLTSDTGVLPVGRPAEDAHAAKPQP